MEQQVDVCLPVALFGACEKFLELIAKEQNLGILRCHPPDGIVDRLSCFMFADMALDLQNITGGNAEVGNRILQVVGQRPERAAAGARFDNIFKLRLPAAARLQVFLSIQTVRPCFLASGAFSINSTMCNAASVSTPAWLRNSNGAIFSFLPSWRALWAGHKAVFTSIHAWELWGMKL